LKMNDKELTRRAAKAAGIEHPGGDHSIHDDGRVWDCKRLVWWNPLHNEADAQALRQSLGLPHGTSRDTVRAAAAMADT
jgi:hypothetical protein